MKPNTKSSLGAFLIILAILFLVFSRQGFKYKDLKTKGKITQATILKKYLERKRTVVSDSASYKGTLKNKYKLCYLLDVSFFTGEKSSVGFQFFEVKADEKTLVNYKEGDEVEIIYLTNDPQNTGIVKSDLEKIIKDSLIYNNYLKNGVKVKAMIEDIDKENNKLKVMFIKGYSSSLGNAIFTTLDIDKSIWDKYKVGQKIEVIYSPLDPKNKVASKEMTERGSFNPFLMIGLAVISFISGFILIRIKK